MRKFPASGAASCRPWILRAIINVRAGTGPTGATGSFSYYPPWPPKMQHCQPLAGGVLTFPGPREHRWAARNEPIPASAHKEGIRRGTAAVTEGGPTMDRQQNTPDARASQLGVRTLTEHELDGVVGGRKAGETAQEYTS